MILQFFINGLVNGVIISLVALGFALVYNTIRVFHIAYASLYMFAPYIMYSFFNKLDSNFYLAITLAIVATIVLSLLIEKLVYQPLERKKSSLNVAMISSIGAMTIIINIVAMLYGNETKIISHEISSSFTLGTIIITYNQIFQFSISAFLIALFFVFLKYTDFGLKTRALRDNKTLTVIFGINIPNLRAQIFILSGFFAAVGGLLIANDVGFDPYVGMPVLLNAVVALIIGGVGKFHAPVVGGVFIGLLQSASVYFFSANWKDAVTFTVLILFLFLRPQGLFGEKGRTV